MKLRFLAPALLVGTLVACRAPRGLSSSAGESGPVASSSSSSVPGSAHDVLDALDHRTPLALVPMMANHQKQNMRDHLAAVQDVVAAAATENFAGVELAAGRMGYSAFKQQVVDDAVWTASAHQSAATPAHR